MSKKNGSNQELAIRDDSFVVAMNGARLDFDPFAESFSWRDVLPSNYWNLDLLEEKQQALGGNPVVTPMRVVIKPVEDPEVPEAQQDNSPKIVLEFAENVPALVFNKTRCTLATKMTGTPNPAKWAALLPPLELYAGAFREMAAAVQILFRPADVGAASPKEPVNEADIDQINDDLFG